LQEVGVLRNLKKKKKIDGEKQIEIKSDEAEWVLLMSAECKCANHIMGLCSNVCIEIQQPCD